MSKNQDTVNLDDAIHGAYEAIQGAVQEYEKTNPPSTLPFNDRGNTKQIKDELEKLDTLVQDDEHSHTSTYGKSSYIESKAETIAGLLPEDSKERDTIEAAQKVAQETKKILVSNGTNVEVDQNKAGDLIAAQNALDEKTGKSGKTHVNEPEKEAQPPSVTEPTRVQSTTQSKDKAKEIKDISDPAKRQEAVHQHWRDTAPEARTPKTQDPQQSNASKHNQNEQQKENKPKKKISSRLMEQVKEIGKTAKEAAKEAASTAKNKIQSIGKGNKKDGGMGGPS